MLELTRFKVFREVATLGSFTKAAESLGYAQPSISHHVAQLERELGAQLFERHPRRIQLTPAGHVFLGYIQSVLLQLSDAEREVSETVRAGGRSLRVAAFPTAAATLMPVAAACFRAGAPTVDLRLIEADPPASLPALTAGEQDLALVYDYPALGFPAEAGVELEPLYVDHMALVLPYTHELADSIPVPLGALSGERWIAPLPSVCRDAFVFACRSAGFTPQIVSQTNDYMAMQGLVAAGVGVALLPRLAVAIARRPGVVLAPISDLAVERVTFIAARTGTYRSPITEAFRAALRQAVTEVADPHLPLEVFEPLDAMEVSLAGAAFMTDPGPRVVGLPAEPRLSWPDDRPPGREQHDRGRCAAAAGHPGLRPGHRRRVRDRLRLRSPRPGAARHHNGRGERQP
jgi:DNA-binding transcriptional LysR family regulator